MSGDKLLTTFAAKVGAPPPKRDEPEPEGTDDLGAFGWLRGRERAIMLELRFRNGNVVALSYAWLERIDFDPSVGVTLTFSGKSTVTITGRNLNVETRPNARLVDGLIRQKVPWIQEDTMTSSAAGARNSTVIESIRG